MSITIGPFANVPAPNDPIRSPWAQQLTQYAVDRLERKGLVAIQTGQNVGAGQVADIAFPTLSSPGFGTGPTFTIPAGWGGVWSFAVALTGAAPPATAFSDVMLVTSGEEFWGAINTGKTRGITFGIIDLTAGQTFKLRFYNSNPGASTTSARLTAVRVAA